MKVIGTVVEYEKNAGSIFRYRTWEETMLETIVIILLVLWLLGMVTGQTLGGALHAIIVVALVIFLVRLVSGRRVA